MLMPLRFAMVIIFLPLLMPLFTLPPTLHAAIFAIGYYAISHFIYADVLLQAFFTQSRFELYAL